MTRQGLSAGAAVFLGGDLSHIAILAPIHTVRQRAEKEEEEEENLFIANAVNEEDGEEGEGVWGRVAVAERMPCNKVCTGTFPS